MNLEIPVGALMGLKALDSSVLGCQQLASKIKSTYGPRGRDKLLELQDGTIIVSNDGATILKHLNPTHPIAQMLVNLSKTQDEIVGDGTTSIVLFVSFLLQQAQKLIHLGGSIDDIIEGYQKSLEICLENLRPIELKSSNIEYWKIMKKVLSVPFHSKLLFHDRFFFADLIISAMKQVKHFDRNSLRIVKIPGGSMQDSILIDGFVFPRPFSYAGFEKQPKKILNPKLLLLNHEIELKHQGEHAKISIDDPHDYKKFIDSEQNIFDDKLKRMEGIQANVILDSQVIGDFATQRFTKGGIVNLGRIPEDLLKLISISSGGKIQTSLERLNDEILGICECYEERTIGNERYCILSGFKNTTTLTLVLRGGSEQNLEEMERSLVDSISVGYNMLTNPYFALGGGSVEMDLSTKLRSSNVELDLREPVEHFANALDDMITTLMENSEIKSYELLPLLRKEHLKNDTNSYKMGVDVINKSIGNMYDLGIYEPFHVKKNILTCATEFVCTVLMINTIIRMPPEETEEERSKRITDDLKKRKYAEKKWKESQK